MLWNVTTISIEIGKNYEEQIKRTYVLEKRVCTLEDE